MTTLTNQDDWAAFALLLIDVQRDFWPDKLIPHFPHFEAKVAELLAFCRRVGIDVIHLRAAFAPDQADWMAKYKLLGRVPCIRGTTGIEPLPCAAALPHEPVLEKQSFDGFQSAALLPLLQARGKRFLLTAGLKTSICVLFTTASAAQQGFLTAMVEDCCGDDPQRHALVCQSYPFIFERTTVDQLASRHTAWLAMLATLEQNDSFSMSK